MERVVSEIMELLGYLLVGAAFLVNLVLAFSLPLMAPGIVLTVVGYLVFASIWYRPLAGGVIVVTVTPILLGLIGASWAMALFTYPAVLVGLGLLRLSSNSESSWPTVL